MRYLLIIPVLFSFSLCFSQQDSHLRKLKIRADGQQIIPANQQLDPSAFLRQHKQTIGLDSSNELLLKKSHTDPHGYQRQHYSQYYRSLPVIGSQYRLHCREGKVKKSTGQVLPLIDVSIKASIPLQEAQEAATEYLLATHCNPDQAHHIDQLVYKNHGLCIIDVAYPRYTAQERLAYQLDLFLDHYEPLKERCYVDAHTGEVIFSATQLCQHVVPGTAETKYYGKQTITVDSVAPDMFVLRDTFAHVHTVNGIYERDNAQLYDYPYFTDDDNYWDTVNADQDEVATDAHYCSLAFSDMMDEEHNWVGIDGEGGDYVAVVHAWGRYYNNAFWDGEKTNYGNGDCLRYDPFTVLDVVGHEYMHGVTDHTSDLIYQDESGALNESISDIFGKALEYRYDQANFTWYVGQRFRKDGQTGFRSMSDPNEKADPKYYQGVDWYCGSGDRGGVHSNSGVFNHWFYLLVEGGEGTNEVGYDFKVDPLGWDLALEIVMGMQTAYLLEDSGYLDAYQASLWIAEDFYPGDTLLAANLEEAWRTIGIYEGINDINIGLELVEEAYFACQNSDVFPQIYVVNQGNSTIAAGEDMILGYTIDPGQETFETLILSEDLLPGDSLKYEFANQIPFNADLDEKLVYNVYFDDALVKNNEVESEIHFIDATGLDLSLIDFEFRADDDCNPTDLNAYRIRYTNNGCKAITDADSVRLLIKTDLQELDFYYRIYNDIYPGDNVISFRSFSGTDILLGFTEFEVEVQIISDENKEDNKFSGSLSSTTSLAEGYLQEYDTDSYRTDFSYRLFDFIAEDSVIFYRGSERYGLAANKEIRTGLQPCMEPEDFFEENTVPLEINACIDASGMTDPHISMNITMLRNGDGLDGIADELKTMVRISHDSMTYPLIYNQPNGDVVYNEFALPLGYIGNLEMEFFVLKGQEGGFASSLDSLDAILLDDFRIFDKADEPIVTPGKYGIFPNPTTGAVHLLNFDINTEYDIRMYSQLGQEVFYQSFFGDQNFSIQNLPAAVYYYVITSPEEEILQGKLVKVN